jgi:VanZ family protein
MFEGYLQEMAATFHSSVYINRIAKLGSAFIYFLKGMFQFHLGLSCSVEHCETVLLFALFWTPPCLQKNVHHLFLIMLHNVAA